MSDAPTVRVGQVWADNDKRSAGRHLLVVAIEPARPATVGTVPAKAVVEQCDAAGTVHRDGTGRAKRTRVRLDRLKPTSTGYRLVKDVEGQW